MVLPSHSKGYSQGFLLDSFEWWWPCCWWWCVMMTTVGPGCYDDKAVTVLRRIIIVYYSSRNSTTMSTTKAALVVNCSLKALQNRSARLWDDTFLFAFCLPALSNLMKIPCMQTPFSLRSLSKTIFTAGSFLSRPWKPARESPVSILRIFKSGFEYLQLHINTFQPPSVQKSWHAACLSKVTWLDFTCSWLNYVYIYIYITIYIYIYNLAYYGVRVNLNPPFPNPPTVLERLHLSILFTLLPKAANIRQLGFKNYIHLSPAWNWACFTAHSVPSPRDTTTNCWQTVLRFHKTPLFPKWNTPWNSCRKAFWQRTHFIGVQSSFPALVWWKVYSINLLVPPYVWHQHQFAGAPKIRYLTQ